MAPAAPVLHDDLFTTGVEPKPDKPSNIAKRVTFSKGDIAAGFRQADVVIERRYTTKPVHQAYIEPLSCSNIRPAPSPARRCSLLHVCLRDVRPAECGRSAATRGPPARRPGRRRRRPAPGDGSTAAR